jgi:GT2 family glycosyltransferase
MGQSERVCRSSSLSWVVLTLGDRAEALARAVGSVAPSFVVVILNGRTSGSRVQTVEAAVVVELSDNRGVPAGRDRGLRATSTEVVAFLDDDAEFRGDTDQIIEAFDTDATLGAVALRLVDEGGETARRHVPRLGGRHPARSSQVALFLGGACAVRRVAYDEVGGYFDELFYGHEEVELCWRLVDAGWTIRYLADVEVFHPKSKIERHAKGWELTGRNRVLIARRSLPWPVAFAHVLAWLAIGLVRAPAGVNRRAYREGWRSGWRIDVDRDPISWRGVWRLTRLGRPPVV